jgi:4-amino-4-deoxy-L-arabinose transferase-like glycosyltransferase
VAVRLIAIDQPFDGTWSWRQSDVAAIARNYFQGGFHFASPQIDWAGDQPGYVGTEFPILPFVAALCYKVTGVHEWVGRIQGVIFFAISLPFFFLFVRKLFGEVAAAWALLFYCLAPIGIMASRCFMPDIPSLVLALIGLYFFERWIDYGAWRSFTAAAIAISLSILIKLPSAIIGVPLACMSFQRFAKPPLRLGAVFRRFKLWLFATITLVPATIWYWHAYQISLKFYPYHFFGAGGVRIVNAAAYLKIAREIFTSTLTPILFLLALIGAVAVRLNARARALHWWLGAMILFFVIVGYGNRHQWYQLPLVPITAAFAGAGCAVLADKISGHAVKITASVLLIALFGLSTMVYERRFYRRLSAPLREAGLMLKEITPENSLIAAADNGDPSIFYYAERKGWHFLEKDGIFYGDPEGSEPAITDLENLRAKGAKYLVFTSDTSWWLDLYPEFRQHLHENSALIAATADFQVYRLDSTKNE